MSLLFSSSTSIIDDVKCFSHVTDHYFYISSLKVGKEIQCSVDLTVQNRHCTKGNLPITAILRSFTVNAAGQEGLKEIGSLFITQSMWNSGLPAFLHTVLAYTFRSNKLSSRSYRRKETGCFRWTGSGRSPPAWCSMPRLLFGCSWLLHCHRTHAKNTSSPTATLGLSRPLQTMSPTPHPKSTPGRGWTYSSGV